MFRGVHAPPATIGPRLIPGRAFGQRFGHEIDSMGAERPAAADPGQPDPAPRPESMPLDRLVRIFGAGRHVAALAADEAGEAQLIAPDGPMRSLLDRARHLA